METEGNNTPASGVENRYKYNGKEHIEELGVNFSDYGARFYDPAIARFTTIDPLAEDYSFQSPYAYAANNPIKFIDYMGLGPIYGPDGTIIGYEVEEGQGPTQIAEDLNENYGCELTCDADWLQIVYDNAKKFDNVFKGEGDVEDKNNPDYESGNLETGTELIITNGFDQTKLKEQTRVLKKYEVEENVALDIIRGKKEGISGIREDSGTKMDPVDRVMGAQGGFKYAKENGPIRAANGEIRKQEERLHNSIRKQDSMKSEIKKTKGQY